MIMALTRNSESCLLFAWRTWLGYGELTDSQIAAALTQSKKLGAALKATYTRKRK